MHEGVPVNLTDPQLRKFYEANFGTIAGFSDDLRQVSALIAAHDFFHMMEGPHSSRVHEAIEQLLSPDLRSGLRGWYQRCGAETNYASNDFRDHLSQLAGERLEDITYLPLNPS